MRNILYVIEIAARGVERREGQGQLRWTDVVDHADHREPDRIFAFAFVLRAASHCACIAINTPATSTTATTLIRY